MNESMVEPSDEDDDGDGVGDGRFLDEGVLELLYVPDFLFDDLRFYFAPTRDEVAEVYVELVARSGKNWSSYYSKKGWAFLDADREGAEGPFRVRPGRLRLEVQEPGRLFSPKPRFRFEAGGRAYPLVSLDKRRPLNPWKPQFIRALEFIKKYSWPEALSRSCQMAVWEIEECGEIAGSTSWINAESVLRSNDSPELRATLADLFYNRPENFPLGSQVYLRVLGNLSGGFEKLLELATHPISRKRVVVAKTLGDTCLGGDGDDAHTRRVGALLVLADDEDPYVRSAALRSLGRNRLRVAGGDAEARVREFLSSEEVGRRIWAAEALMDIDPEQRKSLLQLVKDDPRPLADLGELGEVIVESNLVDAVPYLITRLKDERREIAMDAAEVLTKLIGVDIDLSAEELRESRRLAVKRVQKWWEEKKRERRVEREG